MIRKGRPSQTLHDWLDANPGSWPLAQRAFLQLANLTVGEVVRRAPLAGARRLLEVGSGHGLFALRFVEANAGLEATLFDRPAALEVARETISASGDGSRVRLRAVDYLTDDLGCDHDVALLFNVLHGHDGKGVRTLLGRVRRALTPGGRVVILDQFASDGGGPALRALRSVFPIGLNYLVTIAGAAPPAAEVSTWLREAGFVDGRRPGLRSAPGVSLLARAL